MDRLRVLIVDDEAGMRSAVERALRDYRIHLPEAETEVGFEIAPAASGEEALELISAGAPDIVLLDHKLPQMSGLEVLHVLSEKQYDLLVIVITAYASLETAVTATKRGAYDFLAKPFTPEELKAAVFKAAKHLTLQRQAQKLAREKRQFRFQLISIVAHELKAPLAAIESYLNILSDPALLDDRAAAGHMIERSLIRLQGMRKLIMDLLDLTRLESGQKKRELVELDLRECAAEAIAAADETARARSVSVTLAAPPALPYVADRGEIEIVFNNLVSNAIKYNQEGGRVEVRLAPSDDRVTVEVEDTGIGMNEEEAASLFQEFVRVKNQKTEDIPGSGLGLSIVRKIALLYGGDARVRSEPDQGSVFTVTLKR